MNLRHFCNKEILQKLTDKVGKIENVDYVGITISIQTLLGKHIV